MENKNDFWNQYTSLSDIKFKLILSNEEVKHALKNEDTDKLNEIWDRETNKSIQQVIEGIPLNKDSVVIDFGAGIGRIANILIDKVRKIYCLDTSSIMIDYGNQYCKGKNIKFFNNTNWGNVKIKKNSVDFIYSISTLQHIHKIEEVKDILDKLLEYLKPNGILRFQSRTFTKLDIKAPSQFEGVLLDKDWVYKNFDKDDYKIKSYQDSAGPRKNWCWVDIIKKESVDIKEVIIKEEEEKKEINEESDTDKYFKRFILGKK